MAKNTAKVAQHEFIADAPSIDQAKSQLSEIEAGSWEGLSEALNDLARAYIKLAGVNTRFDRGIVIASHRTLEDEIKFHQQNKAYARAEIVIPGRDEIEGVNLVSRNLAFGNRALSWVGFGRGSFNSSEDTFVSHAARFTANRRCFPLMDFELDLYDEAEQTVEALLELPDDPEFVRRKYVARVFPPRHSEYYDELGLKFLPIGVLQDCIHAVRDWRVFH